MHTVHPYVFDTINRYVETLRAQLTFLLCHFHLPCLSNAKGVAAGRLKEWFQAHGVGADWQGADLSLKPCIIEDAPDDETEALTKQALLQSHPGPLEAYDDDNPPMLIAIDETKM